MASLLISASSLLASPDGGPSRILSPGHLRIEDGVIAEVGEGRPAGAPGIDLDGGLLAPGLVDLQVNGYFGFDMADAGEAGWHTVVRRLPETGVTAFLPTFITAPVEAHAAALRRT